MNQANVKVSFYLKKSEADADGNCPVMAKLNVGKYSEAAFSVKMKVPQSRWTSGRATGKSVAAKEINNRLDEIRAMALNIYTEQSAVRDGVTADEVKGVLLGMASGQETLLGYFKRFISNFEKRVGVNRTIGSRGPIAMPTTISKDSCRCNTNCRIFRFPRWTALSSTSMICIFGLNVISLPERLSI